MEERIRFITHKGQPILLVDVSNCTAEQLAAASQLVPSFLSNQPRGSVLLLADFSGSRFDKAAIEMLKKTTAVDRPHIKRSAWVGTESLPKVFYDNIKSFSRRDLPTFKTREEAMDWLVTEEPASAAS